MSRHGNNSEVGTVFRIGGIAVAFFVGLFVIASMVETVDTGHYAPATRFGEVQPGSTLSPGFHMVHPLNDYSHFNTLARTGNFKGIRVPAADQQQATMDISVQFSIRPEAVEGLRGSVGHETDAIEVHFTPKVRGALRDAGRTTERVEDFYDDSKIVAYREEAITRLQTELGPLGFEVTDVIVRSVDLPEVIQAAILSKKEREQEVEKERAELERVELHAQQVVKKAEADRAAAEQEAEAKKIRAEARAFEIARIQRELAKSPNFIELVKAEAWDGHLPQTMLGDSSNVLFNVGSGGSR